MSVLALDFDGVLHDFRNPLEGKTLGLPLPGAKDAVCRLRQEEGHTIIIFSVKPPSLIEEWMRYYDIPFDRITTLKPEADLYIDDKGMRFHDWPTTLSTFNDYLGLSRL